MKLRVTDRERQIITLRVEGKTIKEIAMEINCSPYTVKQHLHNVYEKFGLKKEADLVRWYFTTELNWKV